MIAPTPAQIRTARDLASLTQTQAAHLVHIEPRAWRRWESDQNDHRAINMAAWELFLLQTGQHPHSTLQALAAA
jgi:DNA-binding transcriptional regulator YiaG